MGRRKYKTGVFRVSVEESDARLQQIIAKRKYSDIHGLTLKVYKFSPCEKGSVDVGVCMTIVQLLEENGRQRHTDFYSFDAGGRLLSHSFSVYREDPTSAEVAMGKRDMSTERLRFHKLAIEEMLSGASLPEGLAKDATVSMLKEGVI